MRTIRFLFLLALAGIVTLGAPGPARAGDRAARAMQRNDADGDGRIGRDEWRKRPDVFVELDADKDGYLTLDELRVRFGGGGEGAAGGPPAADPGTGDGRVPRDALDDETLCGIGRGRRCDIKLAIRRGLFETGLRPRFPDNADCRDIDEQWAISYTYKRNRENYHGGIDMPAPFGTPIIAAAAGTVVAKYAGEGSFRGIEIILRHGPEDTGIPLWIYTQYSHFDEMPGHEVGQRVRMGEVLGPTGNSGRGRLSDEQSMRRRPAIHFAVWFSASPRYAALSRKVIPVDGRWMDPNALFRKKLPLDSRAMKALPEAEKQVPVSIMFEDGATVPADTRIVWPYTCERR